MNNSISQFENFCPELTKDEIKSVTDYLEEYCPQGEAGFMRNYMFRLYWLAKRSNSKKIVELGCTPGGSTIPLLWAAERNDGYLWSCDLANPPTKIPHYNSSDMSKRAIIGGIKASELGKVWFHGEVDFIYLDTSHAYEDTIEEINAWLPHLKEGGLFVFHDTEIYKSEVFRAITHVITNSSSLFELHHWPDCYGHVALQRFNGIQDSCNMMRPSTTNFAPSLTELLLQARS